ncbi:hypothetical protein GCK32_006461 [Trichostrongylus colubriformis]|uniref:Uncharacterized protein n=1 Tax=Trichostrongylus colubriformis TaxID=6319 RepID=A0AAN8EXJ5_TRICO
MLEGLPAPNGRRYKTRLNAAMYAVERAIAATADEPWQERMADDPRRRPKKHVEQRRSQLSTISVLSSEIHRHKSVQQRMDGTMQRSRKNSQVAASQNSTSRWDGSRFGEAQGSTKCDTAQNKEVEYSRRRKFIRRKGAPFVVHEPKARQWCLSPVSTCIGSLLSGSTN